MLASIARSNITRALKAWGGLRGDIPGQMEQTIMPVVALGQELPISEPWSWAVQKAAGGAGNWSVVAIYNKDRRPDDPLGPVNSIVRIDHVRVSCGLASDLIMGIVDSATAGLGAPTSAAAANAAFQNSVVGSPLKITGVGQLSGLFPGVIGDQLYPNTGTILDIDLPPIWLGPGYAWTISPNTVNVAISLWARGAYFHAP